MRTLALGGLLVLATLLRVHGIAAAQPAQPAQAGQAAQAAPTAAQAAPTATEPSPATLQKACNAGEAEACGSLGRAYADDRDRTRRLPKVRQTLKAACERKVGTACTAVGVMTEEGIGQPPRSDVAQARYQEACELGDGRGCGRLAMSRAKNTEEPTSERGIDALLRKGCELGDGWSCGERGARLRETSATEAAALLGRACQALSFPHCVMLGELYETGKVPTASAEKVESTYQAACVAGKHAPSCARLGALWIQSRGDEAAEPVLRDACKAKEQSACADLGAVLMRRDAARKARPYLERSCRAGVGRACLLASKAHGEGQFGRANIRRGHEWYARACAVGEGEPAACLNAGIALARPAGAKLARPIVEPRCDAGVAEACGALARIAKKAERDSIREKACSLGDMSACGELAKSRKGRDPVQARALSARACEGGDLDGCVLLAGLLRSKRGGSEDLEGASKAAERACSGGKKAGCREEKRIARLMRRRGYRPTAQPAVSTPPTIELASKEPDVTKPAPDRQARPGPSPEAQERGGTPQITHSVVEVHGDDSGKKADSNKKKADTRATELERRERGLADGAAAQEQRAEELRGRETKLSRKERRLAERDALQARRGARQEKRERELDTRARRIREAEAHRTQRRQSEATRRPLPEQRHAADTEQRRASRQQPQKAAPKQQRATRRQPQKAQPKQQRATQPQSQEAEHTQPRTTQQRPKQQRASRQQPKKAQSKQQRATRQQRPTQRQRLTQQQRTTQQRTTQQRAEPQRADQSRPDNGKKEQQRTPRRQPDQQTEKAQPEQRRASQRQTEKAQPERQRATQRGPDKAEPEPRRATAQHSEQSRSTQQQSEQPRASQQRSEEAQPKQRRASQQRTEKAQPTQKRATGQQPKKAEHTQERATRRRPTKQRATRQQPDTAQRDLADGERAPRERSEPKTAPDAEERVARQTADGEGSTGDPAADIATCEAGEDQACERAAATLIKAKSYDRAHTMLSRRCRRSPLNACRDLGRALLRDRDASIADAKTKGTSLLVDACTAGDAQACAPAARALMREDASRKDQRNALRLAEKGSNAGDDESSETLATFLQAGSERDRNRAVLLYAELCEGGRASSCIYGADLMLNSESPAELEPPSLRVLLISACNADHTKACLRSGEMLRDGVGGDPDLPLALRMLEKGCEGDLVAACRSGLAMVDSVDGVEKVRRARLHRAPCLEGDITACVEGSALLAGITDPADQALAARMANHGCTLGNPTSCNAIGKMALLGIGRRIHRAQAQTYYERSCSTGNPEGCEGLKAVCATGYLPACAAPRKPESAVDAATEKILELRALGDDERAISEIQLLMKAGQTPMLQAQLGLAQLGAGHPVAAERSLEAALEAKDDRWVVNYDAALRQALGETKQRLGWMEIECTAPHATAAIGSAQAVGVRCGETYRVEQGSVFVEMRAPGYRSQQRSFTVAPGQRVRVTIVVNKEDVCEIPAMVHMGGDAGSCCWPGQSWNEGGVCTGDPVCPPKHAAVDGVCEPVVDPTPRQATFRLSVMGGITNFLQPDATLFRPGLEASGASTRLGERVELRLGTRIYGPLGVELVAGGTRNSTTSWWECDASCLDTTPTVWGVDAGLLLKLHTNPGRQLGAFDFHVGAGIRPFARLYFDSPLTGQRTSQLTAVGIPVELGLSFFLGRAISLDLIGQGSYAIAWRYCGAGPDGAYTCTDSSGLSNEFSWGAVAGLTVHVGD